MNKLLIKISFLFATGLAFCQTCLAQSKTITAGTAIPAGRPRATGTVSSAFVSDIIPVPLEVLKKPGFFRLKQQETIYTDSSTRAIGIYLKDYLQDYYRLEWALEPQKHYRGSGILLTTAKTSSESYTLDIQPGSISIAGDGAGVFYGVQSLLQLIKERAVPCLTVHDRPRFPWRGLSLDVSCHFFSVETVKKYIDLMAHYKLNTFHWHLTDDEGWRIQIDKYPELTAKGSAMNRWAAEAKFRALDNITGGGNEGYFTKDQVREIVAYAHNRYIRVLPEIEMPGHSEAAIFSYPELGVEDSTGETQHEKPIPRVGMYDPSEKVFSFLEDVLTEVMELFPDKYIHIGGDEADMKKWLRSPVAVAVMKKQGLKNEKEVQSYFIKRIEKFVLSKGRKLVGWDEILEGGLAPSATVMSWRGEEGGIAAAKMHHPVVMTPLPYVYFDAPQSDDPSEPVGWNYPLSWQHVYSYDPVPPSLSPAEARYVLGAQGNIWAEKIPTPEHLEYMVYPRALALAEVCWTAKNRKDPVSFAIRLNHHYELLKRWKVNARLPDVEGLQVVSTNEPIFLLTLSHPLRDARIVYTLDGSTPDDHSPLYERPLSIDLKGTDSIFIKTRVTSSLSGQQRFQTALLKHLEGPPVRDTPPSSPGVRYTISSSGLLAGASGTSASILIPAKGMPPSFREIRFAGFLKIEREDDYSFRISADGETVLKLGNKPVIDNRAYHGTVERESLLHLKKGFYPIELWYKNEDDDARSLHLVLNAKSGGEINLSRLLFHDFE